MVFQHKFINTVFFFVVSRNIEERKMERTLTRSPFAPGNPRSPRSPFEPIPGFPIKKLNHILNAFINLK